MLSGNFLSENNKNRNIQTFPNGFALFFCLKKDLKIYHGHGNLEYEHGFVYFDHKNEAWILNPFMSGYPHDKFRLDLSYF